MEEITFETATEIGLIQDDSLEYAYKSVEGCSVLSKDTDRAFESAYRKRKQQVRNQNLYVNYCGQILKVI